MTIESDNLAAEVEMLFVQAAERQRELAAFEAGEREDFPMGAINLPATAAAAVARWRKLADAAPAKAQRSRAVGEPDGLSPDMRQIYRAFRAEKAVLTPAP
jgi:hypothetical protein